MMSKTLRRWEAALLAALSIALCAGTWAQGKQESISAGLVRLHVVAASDDGLEQAIKLRVRDAVLDYLNGRLMTVGSADDARRILSADLDGIAQAAASASAGREVTVTLGRERFPTREYEGMTLPAGSYESLRIVLGAGQGHNWWCVVFPPLCLSAAEGDRLQSVMSRSDLGIVTEAEGYELRFKTVELWCRLVSALSGEK